MSSAKMQNTLPHEQREDAKHPAGFGKVFFLQKFCHLRFKTLDRYLASVIN